MNAEKTLFDEYMEDKEFERLMAQEDVIIEVTESFCRIMQDRGINRSTLAKIMGKTKGYISQLLNGRKNLTIRSMVDIAYSLGYEVRVNFRKKTTVAKPKEVKFDWTLRHKNRPSVQRVDMADDYHVVCPSLSKIAS